MHERISAAAVASLWDCARAACLGLLCLGCLCHLMMSGVASAQQPGAKKAAPPPPSAQCSDASGDEKDKRRIAQVIADCTKRIDKDARDAWAYRHRGRAYAAGGENARALADFDRSLELDPTISEAWVERAHLHFDQQHYDRAISDYTRAIALSKNAADAYEGRAYALLKSGKAQQALPDAELARRLKYGDAGILATRGQIYAALGRRDDAIDDLRRALSLDPKMVRAIDELTKLGVAPSPLPRAPAPTLAKKSAAAPAPKALGMCQPGQAAETAAFARTKVSLATGAARVGEPVTLSWSTESATRDASKPAYLIVTVPDAVRFDGQGFFALGPGAQGPAGIGFGQERTRAVVPLHTGLARSSGKIEVLPYVAGELVLEWAVVGAAPCGAWVGAQGRSQPIGVAPGAPRVVARDEFSNVTADRVIVARRGPYVAHVFKGRVEVRDRATGELVLARQGSKPVFSPTGRFLVLSPPMAESTEVIDLVARRVVGSYLSEAVAWSHADAFLYVLGTRHGWIRLVRAYHGPRIDARESLIEPVGETGGSEEMFVSPIDKVIARGPDFDAVPDAGGLFDHGPDRWAVDLSVSRGAATFLLKTLHDGAMGEQRADHYGPDATDPEMLVVDLTGNEAPFFEEEVRRRFGSWTRGFGSERPQIGSRWETGEPLWATLPSLKRGSDRRLDWPQGAVHLDEVASARLDATGAERSQTARKDRPAAAKGPSPDAKGSKQVVASSTRPATRQRAADQTMTGVVGSTLDHFAHREIRMVSSARDRQEMQRIGKEIAALYPPSLATFEDDPKDTSYSTQAFVDPTPTPTGAASKADGSDRPDQPPTFNFANPGRDLWRWTIGPATYWLTQTVQTGRNGYVFHFTLLSARPGAVTRFADLIEAADGKKTDFFATPFHQFQLGDLRTEIDTAFTSASVVGISDERYLTLVTKPLPRLIVFDLVDWKVACGIPRPIDAGEAQSALMHADRRHVTIVNTDGAVHVYKCESGDAVLSGAYIEGELVLMTRDGYFAGSEDAAGYVEFTMAGLPGRQALAQFTRVLQRPDAVASALKGIATPAPRLSLPPALRIAAGGGASADAMRLQAHSSAGLSHLQIYADGRPWRRIAIDKPTAEVEIPRRELPTRARLTVVAVDANGVMSAPLDLTQDGAATTAAAPVRRGRLLGLTVGIDRYPGLGDTCGQRGTASCDLKLAAADTVRLARAMEQSPLYSGRRFTALVDEKATAPAVLTELDALVAAAAPEDTIVVFFAGHGLIDRQGRLQIGLSSTRRADIAGTALAFETVAQRLQQSRARVVVLLDICHSGLVDRDTVATHDDAVAQLVTQSGASLVVIAASRGRQQSFEDDAARGGLFSVALDRILTQDRNVVDLDGNGAISVAELYRSLKTRVIQQSGGRQTPWLSRKLMFGDFALF